MRPQSCSVSAPRNFSKLYPGDTDAQALRSAIDYGGDSFIAFGTWKWIEAHGKTGDSPVYRYHFELAAPPSKFHPGSFAFHSDDIEYVFGTLDTRPGAVWRPEERKLSEQMMELLDELRQDRRSQRTGTAGVAAVRQGRRRSSIWTARSPPGPDTTRPRYEFLLKGMPRSNSC